MIIDNIKLDESNEEFFLASELVKYGHPLIYLTGKAGTGKTTFLKYLRQTTEKNTIVLAFTGVAAMNVDKTHMLTPVTGMLTPSGKSWV